MTDSCPTPLGQDSRSRCFALAVWLALALLAPPVPPASMATAPGSSPPTSPAGEQGDAATVFAAISADGRYVAIQTRARNFFRRRRS